jgi:multisubunit Na+/H+ antiporter MnhG subunit
VNPRLASPTEWLVRLFAFSLRLYPAEMRHEVGEEMQAIFRLQAAEAARQSPFNLLILVCREARDLPSAILSAHLHAERGPMRVNFPPTSDQTPWAAALLSLLPFFLAGPLRLILVYQPGWSPKEQSLYYLGFLLFNALVVIAGFVFGAIKKFPRWAYPYVFYLGMSLYVFLGYALSLLDSNIHLINNFLLFDAAILVALWLFGFRSFFTNIRLDWTLLSYGFYSLVFYLFASVDFDESPRLNLQVLLPSLISLGAALAHLRIRSAYPRMLALLTGTALGLFIWLVPVFDGMITFWIGIAIGLFLLAGYGTILVLILLAPMVVNAAVQAWRASHPSRGG